MNDSYVAVDNLKEQLW